MKELEVALVTPDNPEYEKCVEMVQALQVPNATLLYNHFARMFNQTPPGKSFKWRMPKYIPRTNITRVLNGRGIEYKKHYRLGREKNEAEELRGVWVYTVTKIEQKFCKETHVGNRSASTPDIRDVNQLVNSLAMLQWMKANAKAKKAIPRLPTQEEVTAKPTLYVIPAGSQQELEIKMKLPLKAPSGIPCKPPLETREDLALMDSIIKESSGEAENNSFSILEEENSGLGFGE